MVEEKMLVLSVEKAAEMLGVSKGLIYRELKSNPDFPRKMIGGRIVIPAEKLKAYVNA